MQIRVQGVSVLFTKKEERLIMIVGEEFSTRFALPSQMFEEFSSVKTNFPI